MCFTIIIIILHRCVCVTGLVSDAAYCSNIVEKGEQDEKLSLIYSNRIVTAHVNCQYIVLWFLLYQQLMPVSSWVNWSVHRLFVRRINIPRFRRYFAPPVIWKRLLYHGNPSKVYVCYHLKLLILCVSICV